MVYQDIRPIEVSIQCTVYNHEHYLRKCLDGFIMQETNFRYEAIVHDDASTDGSAAIIREYAEKYPDIIKPIFEKDNLYSKHDGSLRKVMDDAISDNVKYIAICEGDDYWTDCKKLQLQYDALEQNPDCSICTHSTNRVTITGESTNKTIPIYNHSGTILTPEYYIKSELTKGWASHTSSFFFRRKINHIRAYYPPTFVSHAIVGDLPLMLLALTFGNVYYINQSMSNYRELSGGFNSHMRKDKEARRKSVINYCEFLTLYNEYTNYIYNRPIQDYIESRMFNYYVNHKNFNKMIKSAYFGKLSFFNKAYQIIRALYYILK